MSAPNVQRLASAPPRTPAPGEVVVWSVRLTDLAPSTRHCLAWLAPDEHARAARFHAERDRRRFILARCTLRAILGRALGADPAVLRFTYGPRGKPALVPRPDWPDLQFNLTHAGDYALCALALGRAVGVDLEPHDPGLDALALGRHVFSPHELAALAAAPPADRPRLFLAFWTCKEALVKAHGGGLSLDPRTIDLAAPAERAAGEALAPRVIALPDGPYQLAELDVGPGHAAGLALAGAAPPDRMTLATLPTIL